MRFSPPIPEPMSAGAGPQYQKILMHVIRGRILVVQRYETEIYCGTLLGSKC